MKRIALLVLAPFAMAACQAKAPAAEQPAMGMAASSEQPAMGMAAAKPDLSTAEGKIASAMSAAPMGIASAATIMDMGADMKLTELRKGTNGWTCLPDMQMTPGTDPMCLDEQSVAWMQAWMSHTAPKLNADGLVYMLQGASDASNDDPFAETPPAGADWVNTPPHVMVLPVNPKSLDQMSSDPQSGGPFVMFKGTPYAHVMMPVAAR
jgi:hypothetical protein